MMYLSRKIFKLFTSLQTQDKKPENKLLDNLKLRRNNRFF